MFGRATIRLGIGPHSSFFLVCIIIFLSLLCQFVSHLYFTKPIELVFTHTMYMKIP